MSKTGDTLDKVQELDEQVTMLVKLVMHLQETVNALHESHKALADKVNRQF